jgi:hypothetical protein
MRSAIIGTACEREPDVGSAGDIGSWQCEGDDDSYLRLHLRAFGCSQAGGWVLKQERGVGIPTRRKRVIDAEIKRNRRNVRHLARPRHAVWWRAGRQKIEVLHLVRISRITGICCGAAMTVHDIQQVIELCLNRVRSLDGAQPERPVLLREIIRLRRMADIVSSSTMQPEPMKSHIIAASTREGLSFDNELLEVIGRIFRRYDLWYRGCSRR